jgi:hypothetical protein
VNWYNRLPVAHLAAVLEAEAGVSAEDAAALAAARPVSDAAGLPDPMAHLLR